MLIKPFRLFKIGKYLQEQRVCILDAGAGSHSASITKKWLPHCKYHGIDIVKDYCNDARDLSQMDRFFKMDLTCLRFEQIPDKSYDVLIMSHIIEHLHNGDKVIAHLLPKLKPGGLLYLEYPSERSTRLPSMRETLNFYDDPTHCRIYSLHELYALLKRNNMKILEGGTRRYWINIMLVPLKSVFQLVRGGYIRGGVMWDIMGFAEYIIARRSDV